MRISHTRTLVCGLAVFSVMVLWFGAAVARAQGQTVTGQVDIAKHRVASKSGQSRGADDESDVVVWLTPLDGAVAAPASNAGSKNLPQMVQRNKMFEPHL